MEDTAKAHEIGAITPTEKARMDTETPSRTHHTAIFEDGFRMHYVEAGAGEPVLLLHGFPQTWYAWRKIIPGLSARYRVITPDLRGCGDTDRPAEGYDKATVAADVHRLVERLGLDAVRVVCHDVGMMVGYAYACAHRASVTQLVMMEAGLPGLGLEDYFGLPHMYHLPLFDAPNQLAEMLIAGRERAFVDHFMRQQTYDPTGPDETALDEYAVASRNPVAFTAASVTSGRTSRTVPTIRSRRRCWSTCSPSSTDGGRRHDARDHRWRRALGCRRSAAA